LKKSAHERNRESCDAGEWASGRKWASDAPRGDIAPDSVTVMNIGACGAFIHGLEDEFSQVRMASLDSLCKLAELYPLFAKQSLDFFVDMLNDEIEDIRLKAIYSLGRLGQRDLSLRADQIEIILPVLKDSSSRTREALHLMLSKCRLTNAASLQSCIQSLLDNLRRYPEDRSSIWACCQHLGRRHPTFSASLANELLGVHSFFDLQEPSLDDHAYIAILILIVNAAALHTDVLPLFERYKTFAKHYVYLKDAEPGLVPVIKSLVKDWQLKDDWPNDTDGRAFDNFLSDVFERVQKALESGAHDLSAQNAVVMLAAQDLRRFASIEPSLANAADFARMYLQCQVDLRSLLSDANWINAFLLPVSQTAAFRSSLHRLLRRTFRLIHQFNGLHPIHLTLVAATRVKALALQLVAVIHGSNASALTLCDAFLDEVNALQKYKQVHSIKLDKLSERLLKEIGALMNPKPGSVARVLQPLMLESAGSLVETLDITGLFVRTSLEHFKKDKIRKSYAQMDDPKERTETPLKFTSGLVLTLKVDARLFDIKDIRLVRLKVNFVQPSLSLPI
jgi:integrator complex subunit 4